MLTTKRSLKGLLRADITITDEEMQQLYLDGKPIRRYCLQCKGPKLMVPAKEKGSPQSSQYSSEVPAKLHIVCRTCGTKYWAKVEKTDAE